MKIQWNHVTWYSKAIALALFILISLGGFWFGLGIGYLEGYIHGVSKVASQKISIAPNTAAINPYYENVATWQTVRNDVGGFRVAYPLDFFGTSFQPLPTEAWSQNSFGISGMKFLELDIPKAFEPQTNFDDAKLTIGRSANAGKECLAPSMEGPSSFSTTTINGVDFAKFEISNAGAGNLYQSTLYRTLHNGQCYAVEYTIHSSQLGNYPPEYHLRQFDSTKLTDVLDRIVGTFKFL